MSEIASLCNQILEELGRLGMQTPKSMLPGLPEARIRELTSDLPFRMPRSAIELYMWSEGVEPTAGIGNGFFPGYAMESLPESAEMYRELSPSIPDEERDPDEDDEEEDHYRRFHDFGRDWFPLFRSGGTDFYCIECFDRDAADAEILKDSNSLEPVIAYVSLEAMLRTLLEAYRTGVIYIASNGRLEVGNAVFDEKGKFVSDGLGPFKEIARRYNPGLSYWG